MDLFSMFISGAISWGVGKILDVVFDCNRCGDPTVIRIGNQQSNYLECSNCHKVISQFTNACDFTINKGNSQIGHAVFTPGDYLWTWVCGDGMFNFKEEILSIPFRHRVDGLRGRSVVFETVLRRYSDDSIINTYQDVLNCSYDSTRWDYSIHEHQDSFSREDRGIIAVDSRIMSDFRDILYEDRRIIKPWKT